MADRIPLSAGVVVLIGCGDGAVGAAYRLANPRARLIGIEADPTLARQASTVLDEVYCVAAEPGPLPRLPPADCILVGPGQVEAWAHAAEVLAELSRGLARDGVLLVCQALGAIEAQHGLLDMAGVQAIDAAEIDAGGPILWRTAIGRPPTLRIVSTMLAPIGGVSEVRVVEPLGGLATEAAVTTRICNRIDDVPMLDDAAGIFILHRPALLGEGGLANVRAVLAKGYLVVCEFDDHPSQIPVLHRSDVHNFTAVHAIQTSTNALAAVLGRENPEIAVFPNAMRRLPDVVNFSEPGRINLLFAALNREEDWPEHLDALNAAAAAAGDGLHFHVIADRAFFDALTTPHKLFTPMCDYATYLAILSRCEVSFMPLRDSQFNRCKSDLKFLEAASHRVVALASPVVYGQSIRDGENGLLFDGQQALYDRLMQVVNDPAAARALAERGRTDIARHRMLAYQVAARARWYRDLWSRRVELHQALLARVPALA